MSAEGWYVDQADAGIRLDSYITDYLDSFSRAYLQKLIKDGLVRIDHQTCKANYKLRGGEMIEIEIPEPEPLAVIPENIPLEILYEDEDLIFINKPKDMVVHPAPGHLSGTVVNALLFHCGDSLSGINGVMRPGIVHRIDKDTTGVIVACKNDKAHQSVARQLAEHSITRRYYAICNGVLEQEDGTVNAPIGRSKTNRLKNCVDSMNGRHAVTHYRVLQRFHKYTYVECRLETGRTHQIRVHMDHIHHPLLGDPLYGNIPSPFKLQGQVLHAGVLGLIHPTTGEYLEIQAPLPEYFTKLLHSL